MKIKKLGALLVSAALCAGMAAPAFAFEGEAAPVEQPVLPEVVEEDVVTVTDETSGALTPEGNLTLVDDYHTDYSDGSGQQFITLVSKSGNTFYLVIDRNAKGQQTVHFMNLVDEADLLALMEEDAADAYTAEKEAAAQAEQDICQFGEIMERNGSTAYPEIQTQNEQGAWELSGKGYLAIQSCEDGWDYTIYHSDFSVMDGGQLDEPELTIQEVREEILEAHHMEKGRRVLKDYDLIMDKVADAEELGLSNRPSTLEKLAELAGAREKCDAPECNPFGCKKARVAHEL